MNKLEQEIYNRLNKANVGRVENSYKIRNTDNDVYQPEIDIYISSINKESTFYKNVYNNLGYDFTCVAIEIQGSGSRKHRLGDLINANFNADLSFIICDNKSKLKTCKSILKYLYLKKIIVKNSKIEVINKEDFFKLL